MIITIVVSLAGLSLIFLLSLVRHMRATEGDALRAWNDQNYRVNIEAFRHVVSSEETGYLSVKLAHREFRSVQGDGFLLHVNGENDRKKRSITHTGCRPGKVEQ